jgi:hypothetical protein
MITPAKNCISIVLHARLKLHTNRCSNINASKNTQVENCRSKPPLMNKPNIGNGRRHQSLQRPHTKTLDDPRSNKRSKVLRSGSPKTRHHQPQSSNEVNRSLPKLHSERIAYQTSESNGNNQASLNTLDEDRKRDVEFLSQFYECGSEEGSNGFCC